MNTTYTEDIKIIEKKVKTRGYIFCKECGVTRPEPALDTVLWDLAEKYKKSKDG